MFRAVRGTPHPQPSGPGHLSASHPARWAQAEPLDRTRLLPPPSRLGGGPATVPDAGTPLTPSPRRTHRDAGPRLGRCARPGPAPWALSPPHRPAPPSSRHPWAPSTPWNSPSRFPLPLHSGPRHPGDQLCGAGTLLRGVCSLGPVSLELLPTGAGHGLASSKGSALGLRNWEVTAGTRLRRGHWTAMGRGQVVGTVGCPGRGALTQVGGGEMDLLQGRGCGVGVPIRVAQRWGREREAGRQLERGRPGSRGHEGSLDVHSVHAEPVGTAAARPSHAGERATGRPGPPRCTPAWPAPAAVPAGPPAATSEPCSPGVRPWPGPQACAGCLAQAANSLSHRSLPPICMWLLCLAARWS